MEYIIDSTKYGKLYHSASESLEEVLSSGIATNVVVLKPDGDIALINTVTSIKVNFRYIEVTGAVIFPTDTNSLTAYKGPCLAFTVKMGAGYSCTLSGTKLFESDADYHINDYENGQKVSSYYTNGKDFPISDSVIIRTCDGLRIKTNTQVAVYGTYGYNFLFPFKHERLFGIDMPANNGEFSLPAIVDYRNFGNASETRTIFKELELKLKVDEAGRMSLRLNGLTSTEDIIDHVFYDTIGSSQTPILEVLSMDFNAQSAFDLNRTFHSGVLIRLVDPSRVEILDEMFLNCNQLVNNSETRNFLTIQTVSSDEIPYLGAEIDYYNVFNGYNAIETTIRYIEGVQRRIKDEVNDFRQKFVSR